MSETLSTAACSRRGAVPNPAIRREQFSRDAARRPANAPLQSLRGHTASKEIRTVSFPLFLINPEFPLWTPMPVESIHLTRRECNCRLRLHLSAPPKTAAGASFRCPEVPRLETSPVSATRFSVSPSWLPMSARLALAYPAGKAAFHDFVKQALAKSPSVKVVKYAPDIHDIQVAGNVAYEWGYFDATQKSFEQQAPESLRAKLLRVIRRQPDGSWKFARVMWLPD